MLVIHGIIFLNGISDSRPIPYTENEQNVYPMQQLILYFIQVQGVIFISITSNIMNGIFSVVLTCTLIAIIFSSK